MLQTYLDFS